MVRLMIPSMRKSFLHPYLQCSCCEKKAQNERSKFDTLIDVPQTLETEERIKQLMTRLETYQVIIKNQKDIFFVLHEMNYDSLIFNFYID